MTSNGMSSNYIVVLSNMLASAGVVLLIEKNEFDSFIHKKTIIQKNGGNHEFVTICRYD